MMVGDFLFLVSHSDGRGRKPVVEAKAPLRLVEFVRRELRRYNTKR